MKRGRPPSLPVESPDWISYGDALQEAIERFQSTRLAIKKLNDAFAADAIRCKIESTCTKPELVKRDARIAVRFLPAELRNDPSEEGSDILLNGKPRAGWLFLWNFDLKKYFGIPTEPVQAAQTKAQEIPAPRGHPVVYDWREITLFADRLRRTFPGIKRSDLLDRLRECIEAKGIKVPSDSELEKAVTQVLTFDERHPIKPK